MKTYVYFSPFFVFPTYSKNKIKKKTYARRICLKNKKESIPVGCILPVCRLYSSVLLGLGRGGGRFGSLFKGVVLPLGGFLLGVVLPEG